MTTADTTPTPEQLAANLRADALILKDSKKLEDQLLSDVADTWAGRLEASLAARGPVVAVAELMPNGVCHVRNCEGMDREIKDLGRASRPHREGCVVGQALAAWATEKEKNDDR